MENYLDMNDVKETVRCGRLEWERHALERMLERGIRRSDVRAILFNGEIIENYPEDRPFPSVLILGWCARRPLHAVVAVNLQKKMTFVITVYEPSLKYFEAEFKVRRRK